MLENLITDGIVATEMSFYRMIPSVQWTGNVSNVEVLQKMKTKRTYVTLRKKKRNF